MAAGTVLQEEGSQRQLEGGDRTVGVGEGGLEMGEDLSRGLGRRVRRRGTASKQCGADLALGQDEALPEALPGSNAEVGVKGADGSGDAASDGALEESPEQVGGEAAAVDFVGEPNAERASATGPEIAVAAKEASGAARFALGAAVVEAVQRAVLNQRADDLAVRTRHLLEPLGQGAELLGGAKPGIAAHVGSLLPGKE